VLNLLPTRDQTVSNTIVGLARNNEVGAEFVCECLLPKKGVASSGPQKGIRRPDRKSKKKTSSHEEKVCSRPARIMVVAVLTLRGHYCARRLHQTEAIPSPSSLILTYCQSCWMTSDSKRVFRNLQSTAQDGVHGKEQKTPKTPVYHQHPDDAK